MTARPRLVVTAADGEAIGPANATGFGLARYFFSRDLALVWCQAFMKDRDKNCGWKKAELASGTGAGDAFLNCLVTMTEARTTELTGSLPRPAPTGAEK